jgi:flavin-dependent dehydrogenase
MQHFFDVVILGAGPAGVATALALRKARPHLSIVIVEASDFQTVRPGEILSAEAKPVLQQLDVFDCFMGQNHPQVASANIWGSRDTAPNAFGDILPDSGWHIDRARFDGMLAGVAAASGVAFIRATLTGARTAPGGFWQVTARSAMTAMTLNASFVVDATGRSARFASLIDINQTAHDTLVGVVRIIELERASHSENGTLIEAFEHGWWYSTPLAGNRLAVAAMTDADISKRLQLTDIAQWSAQLNASPLTRQRAENLNIKEAVCVRAAHTRSLTAYSGRNWLAVGDAATSIDPLPVQGILRALRFGIHASDAIGAYFTKQSNLTHYEYIVQSEFQNYLSQRTENYRKELRWEQSPFWMRRHHPIVSSNGFKVRKATLSRHA